MKKFSAFLSLSLLGFLATVSPAATIVNSGGTPLLNNGLVNSLGATTIDFSSGTLTLPTYTEDGVTYSGLSSGSITNTSTSGQCAQPPADTTSYLCVGPSRNTPVTATFGSLMNYFGFYVGSVDQYNSLKFYDGNTFKFTLTGSEIATRAGIVANGNQSVGRFINIFATTVGDRFNKVEFISSSNALETDNHAFALLRDVDIPTNDGNVPEPSTFLTILPAAAFFYFRRKR
jgi:hypothetical protein